MGEDKTNPYCLKCLFFIKPKNVTVQEIMELLEIGWCFGVSIEACHESDGPMHCFEEHDGSSDREIVNRRQENKLKDVQDAIRQLQEEERKIKDKIEKTKKRMGV